VTKNGSNVDVQFYNKNGRKTQGLQIYRDIDQLHHDAGISDDAGRKTYSMSQNTAGEDRKQDSRLLEQAGEKKSRHGTIEIAGIELEHQDVIKIGKVLEGSLPQQ